MTSRSSFRSALFAGLLVVGALAVSGCSESYEPLELRAEPGVATLPVTINYSRRIEQWCDTDNKINPSGCRDSFERLTFRSASCGSPDCTIEDTGTGSTLRLVATRAGTYTVRLEVRGEQSNEIVTGTVAVEILAPEATEVKVTARIASPVGGGLYTALPEGGGAWMGVSLAERGTGRTIRFDAEAVRWTAEGADVARRGRDTVITNARTGQAVVTATLSDAVHGEASFDVVSPAATMRTHVSTRQELEDEPTLVEVHAATPGQTFFTALVDDVGRRFPGGAERLRVEGEGCALRRLDTDYYLNAEVGMRELDVRAGARCRLIVTDSGEQRIIAVSRAASSSAGEGP